MAAVQRQLASPGVDGLTVTALGLRLATLEADVEEAASSMAAAQHGMQQGALGIMRHVLSSADAVVLRRTMRALCCNMKVRVMSGALSTQLTALWLRVIISLLEKRALVAKGSVLLWWRAAMIAGRCSEYIEVVEKQVAIES